MSSERVLKVDVPAGIEHGATRVVEQGGHRVQPERAARQLGAAGRGRAAPVLPSRRRRRGVPRADHASCKRRWAERSTCRRLEGKIKLRVPPSTQPGQVLRVRGKGVEHRLRSGRGDQLVEVAVEIPARLTPRARELIEELGRELGEDVQPQQQGFLEKLRGLFG